MTTVFSIILSLYCLLVLAFLIGWVRIRRQTMPARTQSMPAISIVVAFRNEEENIQSLIHDLSAMVYPREKFEVLLVNDHSTDGSTEKVKSLIRDIANMKLFDLPDGVEGKKAALSLGINKAAFEIIATTDADCRLSKNWLQCLSPYFEIEETKMLVGAVKLIPDKSFFSRLQVTEFISLVGSSAATIGLGHPVMCNGANLSFRKQVFNEVKGYDDNIRIASGDDEFLMRKIFSRYPEGIRFLNFYEATVSAQPQKTGSDFFFQRLRWAGKWKHNSDLITQALAIFIFISQVSFIEVAVSNVYHFDKGLAIILFKLFLEGVLFFWVGRFLDRRFDVLAFICLQIIYPIYVIVIALTSLVSSYRWKDRNYK